MFSNLARPYQTILPHYTPSLTVSHFPPTPPPSKQHSRQPSTVSDVCTTYDLRRSLFRRPPVVVLFLALAFVALNVIVLAILLTFFVSLSDPLYINGGSLEFVEVVYESQSWACRGLWLLIGIDWTVVAWLIGALTFGAVLMVAGWWIGRGVEWEMGPPEGWA